MYCLVLVQCLAVMQLCKGQYAHSEHSHDWDIRHSVPGEPGQDYPVLAGIPKTSFSCAGKEAGYYADIETDCQVFRVCTLDSTYGFQSFLCPNGTIFNQEVAVCDWWMNAKCEHAEDYYNNNIEKFNRLRFGPQMMSDVVKMLTHTVKNPYNNVRTDTNYIQKYKVPTGQLLENGALSEDSHRTQDKSYVPPKNIETTYEIPNYDHINDNIVSSSTLKPNYHSRPSVSQIVEQKKQFAHSEKRGPTNANYIFKNSHKAKLIDNSSTNGTNSEQNHELYRNPETLKGHIRKIPQRNTYRGQTQNTVRNNNNNIVDKQIGRVMNRRYKYFSDKNNLNIKYSNKLQSAVISTVGTKTLSSNDQNANSNPMSHVIFKSWVLAPTESAKLILEPTPYIYSTPKSIPSPAKLITKSSGYIYNIPTSRPKSQKILSEQGYTYNKPHSIGKNSLSKLRSTPVPFRTTILSKLYLTPTNVKPTVPVQLHIEKVSTHNSRLYIPPSATPEPLPKLYLPSKSKIFDNQNEKLIGSPTSPTPAYLPPNNPILSNTNQTITLNNPNNLTFTDILTKNRLDTTVKNIVKDTHNVLTTSNRLTDTHNQENLAANYDLHFQHNVNNDEQLRGFQHFTGPSVVLQPPIDTMHLTKHNSNQLVALPYFKEINTNIIETPKRTVSLKISLPEETVAYLFQNKKNGDFDKLEILNTGMENYLVLTDNKVYSNLSGSIFIPLGKLTLGENMIDSMNSVKEYQNYRKQQQNANNEDLSDIANKISDLTSSQFAENQIENKDESHDRPINFEENSEIEYSLKQSNEIHNTHFHNNNNNLNSKVQSELMKTKLYSGELYRYSVPDVSDLLLNEQSQNRNSFESKKQHTEVGDLEESVQEANFPKPIHFEEKSSGETEIINSQFQSPASQQPARLQAAPSDNREFNSEEHNPHKSFKINDATITTQVRDGITKSGSNEINSEHSFKNENTLENLSSREIEIRFIPSISFRVDKKKDLNKLLYEYLLEPKKLNQLNIEKFRTNNHRNKDYKSDHLTSEIDYVVNHPANNRDDKANYKVPESTYIGPSSYSVSQASIGSLEPQQIQTIRPNNSLEFSNYESSRLEHMDENNGYSKVSPLPPFSF